MGCIRVLLADDNPALLAAIQRLLAGHVSVIGAVGDGIALVNEAKRLAPEVLVIDISMPLRTGLEAIRLLKAECVQSRAIVLTIHEDRELVEEAFASGAYGYVSKSSADKDLVPAIRAVAAGGRFVSPTLGPLDSL